MSDQDNTPTMTFDEALKAFTDKIDAVCQEANPGYHNPVTLEHGTKNVRIVKSHVGSSGRSVYCFVEIETGNILKASGWKAPAKGIRGNIYKVESYDKVDPYGSWLYAR